MPCTHVQLCILYIASLNMSPALYVAPSALPCFLREAITLSLSSPQPVDYKSSSARDQERMTDFNDYIIPILRMVTWHFSHMTMYLSSLCNDISTSTLVHHHNGFVVIIEHTCTCDYSFSIQKYKKYMWQKNITGGGRKKSVHVVLFHLALKKNSSRTYWL